jgi:hypothetical protein
MTKTILFGALHRAAALVAVAFAAGCSAIGSASLPHPGTSHPTGLVVSPTDLSMGPGDQGSLSASESGYDGTYGSTDDCSGIATVESMGATQFIVTGVAPGLCTVTVSDSKGNFKPIGVSVQSIVIGGQ